MLWSAYSVVGVFTGIRAFATRLLCLIQNVGFVSAMPLGLMFVVIMPQAHAQKTPYLAVVLEEDTPLRAAAGRTYYVVGRLPKGAVVQVDDVLFKWSRVKVPAGTTSYIRQQHVDRRGDGSVGVVNSDYVEVFAIANDSAQSSPEEAYIAHGLVPKGQQVKIIKPVGNSFLIESPAEAYAFLGPNSVREATATEQAQWAQAQMQGQKQEQITDQVAEQIPEQVQAQPQTPAEDEAVEVDDADVELAEGTQRVGPEQVIDQQVEVDDSNAVVVEVVEQSESEAQVATELESPVIGQSDSTTTLVEPAGKDDVATVRIEATSQKLLETEKKYLPLFLQPVDQQPLAEMKTAYEGLLTEADLTASDMELVQSRLVTIASNQGLAQTLKQLKAAQLAAQAAQAQDKQANQQKQAQKLLEKPTHYDVVGVLQVSPLYDGVNLPKLYRLVDPTSFRTIAFVDPTGYDMSAYVGQVVGLTGKLVNDASLRRRVLSPTAVERLEPADKKDKVQPAA